jgi:signal transduction histidine kinase
MNRVNSTRRVTTAAGITAAVAVSIAGSAVALWAAVQDNQSTATAVFNGAVALAFTLVGAVVAGARPKNVIGWLMLGGGALWSVGGACVALAYHGIVAHPGSVAGASALAVSGSATRAVGWYLTTIGVAIFFPDGHVAGPRWRWLRTAFVIILVASIIDPITDKQGDLTDFGAWQNPIGLSGPSKVISAIAFLGHVPFGFVVTIAAVVQLVQRWRRGSAFERQQLTLFAAAVALTLIAVPIAFATSAGNWIFGAAALPLPFAIGFAVLARGLYDLRTAANRSLVWITLTAVVAGIYALLIAGVGSVLHVNRDRSWLPWVAVAVIAVSFAPLRDGLQRAVNRLTYGRWDEPYDVLASLGQRVEASADVDRLLADVVGELTSLGLRDVTIRDAQGQLVAGSDNVAEAAGQELLLSAYGEPVGTLAYREPANPMRARDRQLLDDLAGHLGSVLHAHQLTRDLRLARERLVLAREEERRRLRRDLHDGLGPALAGHLLRLDVLAGRVRHDPQTAADIDSLRDDLRNTVLEVRRVVEGLRPPALDELGLIGAVEQATQRLATGTSLDVTVESDQLPLLPAAVEVAAFRIVTEAVTNVVRHAQASTCRIQLAATGGRLSIAVTDNGHGLVASDTVASGHGLQTMRERAEELRGRVTITACPGGGGTAVVALLPMPKVPHQHAPAAGVTAR